MVVDFSKIDLKERPMLVLKTQSDEVIQTLGYAFNVEADLMYNEVSTLTFDLPAYVGGMKTPNYDEVKGTRLIDLVGVGMFLLVDPTTEDDGVSEIKHCKAYSLEYEFTKKQFYIAGNEDDADDDGNIGYKMVYKFYDAVNGVINKDTIIGRIQEKMPEWTFVVDSDLWDKYRTFDSDVSDNVYNFIKSTVQETYGCIFDFDTYNRQVNVISTESVIPQRQIYLSQDNLIKQVDINEDSDGIVTCLDVNGEEGVSIRFVNPTGQNNIYDLHYFLDELPASLRTKWNEWTAACEAQRQTYFNLAMSYQVKTADILAEEVKLVDLQGKLKAAEAVQGAEVTKPDSKQSDRDAANAAVTSAKNAVNAQQSAVNSKTAEKNSILSSIQSINYSLAWEPVKDKDGNVIGGPWKDSKGQPFSAEELKILRRYLFEDSLEDSSFALATTNSYVNKDVGSELNNITVNVTKSTVERAISSSTLYSIAGGEIKLSTLLSAKIIRGTADINPSGKKVVFTAYLERGDYSQTSFEEGGSGRTLFDCGTITMVGTYTSLSYNGTATQEGIYSGNTLTLNGLTGQVYFTKNTTEYEQYSVEWDLYNYGKEVLEERSEPSYTFNVESGNFIALDEFFIFQSELKLGQRIYLNLNDSVKTPYVTSVHLNYEDLSDFNIEFCNTYRSSDSSFRLGQLLEQSVRLGKSLNIKGGMYSQFQATGAQNAVKDFMNSALDIAKNNVLSSENQAITFDESGFRLRKWKNRSQGTYEDEQIWMNDNTIAFTDDGWSTAKMAIGKIIDPNISGSGTAYGIAAPYLVGTILAGSNLVITAEGNTFKIDGSGIRIKTSNLTITNDNGTNGKTFAQTQEDTRNKAVSDAKTYTDGSFDDFMDVYDHGEDGLIVTYYSNTEPEEAEINDLWYHETTVTNHDTKTNTDVVTKVGTLKRCIKSYILKSSTDTETNRIYDYISTSSEWYEWMKKRNKLEANKVYYVTDYINNTKKIYQGTTLQSSWRKKTGADCWELVQDPDAVSAVQSAANAKFIADHRINSFRSPAEPRGVVINGVVVIPLGHGDLWHKTTPSGHSPGDTDSDGYTCDKTYWYDAEVPMWRAITDGEVLKKITTSAEDIRSNLVTMMEVMDDKMNVFFVDDDDAFPTVTDDKIETNDILFYEGKNNRNWKYSSASITLNPNCAYRITVTGTTISNVKKEDINAQAIESFRHAHSFQNTVDKKSSIYARPTPPGSQSNDEQMDASDDGDLWVCTPDPNANPPFNTGDTRKDSIAQVWVYGGEYTCGKMYRWDTSKWFVVEDPNIDRVATALGRRMKELMQVLDPNDTDINIFELKQTDNFNSVTAGAQNGDLLIYTGTSARSVTVNGQSVSLTPNGLYRITVSGGKITALTEETDADTKAAIISARSFQNYTDGKSVIYAQKNPPDTSKMTASDNGDIWICTEENGKPVSGGYTGGKMYRYQNGATPPWVLIEDPFISDFNKVFDSINGLREKLDEKVVTFYQDTVPTDAENGDLWYYTGTKDITVGSTKVTNGKVYRLKVTGTEDSPTKVWQELTDPTIAQALENAATAQNIADKKAQTFWTATPPTPQEGGDGDLWYCTMASGTGTSPLVEGGIYQAGRLYYCTTALKWKLCDDKAFEKRVKDAEDILKDIYENGGLVAEILAGTISATQASMNAADGNIIYNNYGMWLKNNDDANNHKAIWMNEAGILFGHEAQSGEKDTDYMSYTSASENVDMGLTNKKWYWTTAISHSGITAQALLGKTMEAVNITGASELNIGEISSGKYAFKVDKSGQIFAGTTNGTDYNFKVDKNGNVTINGSGTFSGTIHANDGDFKGTVYANDLRIKNGTSFTSKSIVENGKIDGDYLNVKQIDIRDNSDNIVLRANSNGITLQSGAISWGSISNKPNDLVSQGDLADVATSGRYSDLSGKPTIPTLPSYIQSTYISQTEIRSPTIQAGNFYGASYYNSEGTAHLEVGSTSGGYGDLALYNDSGSIIFGVGDAATEVEFYSRGHLWLIYNVANSTTYPRGKWDFGSADVSGLSSTATFG